MAVWRAGVTGAFGEEAVDLTLLASEQLGQRCALPTTTATTAAGRTSVMSLGRNGRRLPLKKGPVVPSIGPLHFIVFCLSQIRIRRRKTLAKNGSGCRPQVIFRPPVAGHPHQSR
jgi:hypothetical protein